MEDILVGNRPSDVAVEYYNIANEAGSEVFGNVIVVLKGEDVLADIDYALISEIHNVCF